MLHATPNESNDVKAAQTAGNKGIIEIKAKAKGWAAKAISSGIAIGIILWVIAA